jgi:transcriptional regulator with XRE-family HTH domain
MQMEFGEWLRQQRQSQGFDVRGLAEKSHVDPSTISRIENEHTQSTLYTAYRLCKGLGVSLSHLYRDLAGLNMTERKPVFINEGCIIIGEENVITREDIRVLLDDYRQEKESVYHYLAESINEIFFFLQKHVDKKIKSPQFTFENMRVLLARNYRSVLSFDLEYPRGNVAKDFTTHDVILYNYNRKGVLLLEDAGVYIKGLRRSVRGTTLEGVKSDTAISASVLSRLEDGALERIKFSDILNLDSFFNQSGKFVDMCWDICEFEDWKERNYYTSVSYYGAVISREYKTEQPTSIVMSREKKLISIYVRICRWYQYLAGNEFEWHKYSSDGEKSTTDF